MKLESENHIDSQHRDNKGVSQRGIGAFGTLELAGKIDLGSWIVRSNSLIISFNDLDHGRHREPGIIFKIGGQGNGPIKVVTIKVAGFEV